MDKEVYMIILNIIIHYSPFHIGVMSGQTTNIFYGLLIFIH